ncbi:hypothetical protein [uncultured Ramlibacter sp.]|uniref:hypothetical protein n=1 Tax=uncultured Ramlibacter sp. TaxID=260755 RepID=UPI0026026BC2|nr:hypothetical protein [uncultured Ramlibacter sp.]
MNQHFHCFTAASRSRLLAVLASLLLAACGGSATSPVVQQPEQGKLCEVNAWRLDAVAKACKPGQKIVFLPETFGNEQLPVIFAAVNCDLRYQVALTRGGVSCIYGPINEPLQQGEATAASK